MYQSLDLQFFAQEKTEQATPKKKRETREKGQVPKSTDVNTAFILLFVFLFLWFIGSYVAEQLFTIAQFTWQADYLLMDITSENVSTLLVEYIYQIFLILGPILLASALGGIASNYLQVGLLFAPEAVKMKLSKINPLKGAKRIFSIRAIVELLKSLLKITFVALVTFSVIWFAMDDLLALALFSVEDGMVLIGNLIVIMGLSVGFLLMLISVLDYTYQRYDHEKNIRMSKQDIKDEHKKTEGDPQIKGKMKQRQKQMATNRMMQEVPKADVVITNPTHYAIALKYDDETMEAPQIVAKGVDYVALKLKNIAKHNDVVTVENRALARALYDQTNLGDQVPEDLFKAVAEVLAYVYRIQNRL
ncbi:flagellar biosynthesis protein FlhB [Texcoconibacillus texcoconensis]|uniref:Flagellar biosynthetic protein FlhB n=1 Tax=Texcoconibacillus texcoconensis TaxID=1095777 RepID=A0A840QL26_9BACI|nr:flagellar biosynthesis protein FlhB [Texcoconibacillus texcoconensis]MBB5172061.1 flagellar biosynthetic protein FlhB [Texcoconibacillus texcoconensis]